MSPATSYAACGGGSKLEPVSCRDDAYRGAVIGAGPKPTAFFGLSVPT
jgi:hypothetical protein